MSASAQDYVSASLGRKRRLHILDVEGWRETVSTWTLITGVTQDDNFDKLVEQCDALFKDNWVWSRPLASTWEVDMYFLHSEDALTFKLKYHTKA